MTERKPPGASWQSWVEYQIEAGRRSGAFDDLPGHGKPIADLDQPHDEFRWVKKKLRAEDVVRLPPALAIRGERDAAVEAAMSAVSEAEVRTTIEQINARIRYLNSHATSGPPSTVVVIETESIVEQWRRANQSPTTSADAAPASADSAAPSSNRRRARAALRRLASRFVAPPRNDSSAD